LYEQQQRSGQYIPIFDNAAALRRSLQIYPAGKESAVAVMAKAFNAIKPVVSAPADSTDAPGSSTVCSGDSLDVQDGSSAAQEEEPVSPRSPSKFRHNGKFIEVNVSQMAADTWDNDPDFGYFGDRWGRRMGAKRCPRPVVLPTPERCAALPQGFVQTSEALPPGGQRPTVSPTPPAAPAPSSVLNAMPDRVSEAQRLRAADPQFWRLLHRAQRTLNSALQIRPLDGAQTNVAVTDVSASALDAAAEAVAALAQRPLDETQTNVAAMDTSASSSGSADWGVAAFAHPVPDSLLMRVQFSDELDRRRAQQRRIAQVQYHKYNVWAQELQRSMRQAGIERDPGSAVMELLEQSKEGKQFVLDRLVNESPATGCTLVLPNGTQPSASEGVL
jgi:hypothetical protein